MCAKRKQTLPPFWGRRRPPLPASTRRPGGRRRALPNPASVCSYPSPQGAQAVQKRSACIAPSLYATALTDCRSHKEEKHVLSQIIETGALSPPPCCTQAAARPSNGRCGYACGAYGPHEARWRTVWRRLTPPPLTLCAVAFVAAAAAAMQPPPPPPPAAAFLSAAAAQPRPSISLNGAVSLALGTPLLWRTEVLLYGRLPPHPLPIPPVKTR